jgi:hypothetical protein
MSEHEALPLPWCGREAQEVADEDAVRAGVGHEEDSAIRIVDLPHREASRGGSQPSFGEEEAGVGVDAIDEVSYGFSTDQTLPALLGRTPPFLRVGGIGTFARRSVPQRIPDLLQPLLDRFVETTVVQERTRGLPRPNEG